MKLKGTIGFGQFQWTLSGTSLGKKYLGHSHTQVFFKYQNDSCVFTQQWILCGATLEWKYVGRAQKNVCEKDKKGAN